LAHNPNGCIIAALNPKELPRAPRHDRFPLATPAFAVRSAICADPGGAATGPGHRIAQQTLDLPKVPRRICVVPPGLPARAQGLEEPGGTHAVQTITGQNRPAWPDDWFATVVIGVFDRLWAPLSTQMPPRPHPPCPSGHRTLLIRRSPCA
jgi:hypothetical protein